MGLETLFVTRGRFCVYVCAVVSRTRAIVSNMEAVRTVYISDSQPPGRGPVPDHGINYIGPREILLELITNLNVILYLST
jgi:hypothetical protein